MDGFEITLSLTELKHDRLVIPQRLYKRGIFYVVANDAPVYEPRSFFVKEGIDLDHIFKLLYVYWAANRPLSKHFSPLRRLPRQFLEAFEKLNGLDSLVLFEKLAQEGYFYPVTNLSRGYQPKGIPWEEVYALCYR